MFSMKPVPPPEDYEDLTSSPLPADGDVDELTKKTDELAGKIDRLMKQADERQESETKKPRVAAEPNAAAELIRSKVEALYEKEPSAREEVAEAKAAGSRRSKHQNFIYQLTTSGKSLADIQTEWHDYYQNLPDGEKHQVWQEFYEMHGAQSHFAKATKTAPKPRQPKPASRRKAASVREKIADNRSIADLKQQILAKASGGGKISAKHHLKSLLFGVGMGLLVLFIILFGFFNERFIAPLISPSRNVSATPIIPTGDGVVSPDPKILIPKINVEVPVVYGLGTNEEKAVQHALEEGVVHYAGTPEPGQTGNVVIVGHSSNNILNKGKYKFAFVLLKRMEVGDTMYLQKGGQRYTYQVFENRVIPPSDVSVLGTSSRPNTITLITCDPPGTSINRRVVVAEQISPDPAKNTAGQEPSFVQPTVLPSNAPSLWQRLFGN